jgi:hypothetical protein
MVILPSDSEDSITSVFIMECEVERKPDVYNECVLFTSS